MFTGRLLACFTGLLIATSVAAVQPDTALASSSTSTEARLIEAWELWQSGEMERAASEFRALLAQRPQYKLAWLLYGDLLNAMSGGRTKLPLPSSDRRVQGLSDEMERRLIKRDLTSDAVPANLIHISGETSRAIVVDLSQGRLFVMERSDDGWRRVRDHYAGIGELGMNKRGQGDLRTPVGVYHIDGFLSDSALPDLYGAGALTLDYPNAWDHADKRYGHGIWIHGVPRDTYVRAPQSSRGCVTIANEDFESLHRSAGVGTAVVLADTVQWLFAEEAEALKQEWMERIDQWRLAWLSADRGRVRGFYAQAPTAATYREFEVDGVNVFQYPGENDLVLAQFRVARQPGGKETLTESKMQQFWRYDRAEGWKIVFEKGGTGSSAKPKAAIKKKKKKAVKARMASAR